MSWEDELCRMAAEGAAGVVQRHKIPSADLTRVERELDAIFGRRALDGDTTEGA